MAVKLPTGGGHKKHLGRKVKIRINNKNMFESFVEIDGHSIHGVDRVELKVDMFDAKTPVLIIHLHPDLIEVDGDVESVESFLNLKKAYDRFDDLDTGE